MDKNRSWRLIGHWHDAGESIFNTKVHTGWRPHHWIQPWGYWIEGECRQAGGGWPCKNITVESSCNLNGGHGGSWDTIDGASKGQSSPACRVHSRQGGVRGHMASGSNGKHSWCHAKENQDLQQVMEVLECRHYGKREDGQKRETEETELRRDH